MELATGGRQHGFVRNVQFKKIQIYGALLKQDRIVLPRRPVTIATLAFRWRNVSVDLVCDDYADFFPPIIPVMELPRRSEASEPDSPLK